jgi:hypothetical protein
MTQIDWRYAMSKNFLKYVVCIACGVLFMASLALAQKSMPETVTIKIEGAKMAPVTFSHPTHVDKAKLDCVVCHHKDKDPKQPVACTTCHDAKAAKDKAPAARDAFHNRCQTCHKDMAAKGKAAPTKCNECHKK